MAEAVERIVRLWILTKSDEDLSFLSQGLFLHSRYLPIALTLVSRNPEWRNLFGGLGQDIRTISDLGRNRNTCQR